MEKQLEPFETLSEIRSIMNRSTKFLSLNGLSGVFAGIFALLGAAAAYVYLNPGNTRQYFDAAFLSDGRANISFYRFVFLDGFLVLTASVSVALILSVRKARKNGLKIWDRTAKRLLFNLMIPLVAGGLFCLIMIYHRLVGFVAPATLLFYGLALINASKYTLDDIRYLGLMEVGLGLASAIWLGYGLLFWSIGFGVLHILYGAVMYFKYEK